MELSTPPTWNAGRGMRVAIRTFKPAMSHAVGSNGDLRVRVGPWP